MKTIHTKEYKQYLSRLRQARIDSGLSQEEVAKRLKKPQSYVSKSESGERRLDLLEMTKFLKIYNKNIEYLKEK